MNAVSKALRLEPVPPARELLAILDPSTSAALKTLLPVRPLLHLLSDLQNLMRNRGDGSEAVDANARRNALLDIGRLAMGKHPASRELFRQVSDALASEGVPTDESLAAIGPANARLAMEMFAFAADLLVRAGLREKAVEAFQLATRIADVFQLPEHRAIVLHQMGIFLKDEGRFAEATAVLTDAGRMLQPAVPEVRRANDHARAAALVGKLTTEYDPELPADVDRLLDSDPQIELMLVPALAAHAIDRDEMRRADLLLARLRNREKGTLDGRPDYLLAEARLARRQGAFDKAANLLDRATQAPAADVYRRRILQQRFFLERDLRQFQKAAHLLEDLRSDGADRTQITYQQALLELQTGSPDEARSLFETCIRETTNEVVRANCFGMLGAHLDDDYREGTRHLYAAISIYMRLGKVLDHAIVLLNLAKREWILALHRKRIGDPPIAIENFTRADRLLETALRLAEPLDARNFVLDLLQQRARLEWDRARPRTALRHFKAVVTQLEMIYLSFTDRERAEQFHAENRGAYDDAISCALVANRPAEALSFSERAKARRLMRDYAISGGAIGDAAEIDAALIGTVRTLRFKLLEGRPLSAAERLALNGAEERLAHVLSASAQVIFRVTASGLTAVPPGKTVEEDDEVVELPGGGVVTCSRCGVFNQIASTHCSACEMRLPKSRAMTLFSGDESTLKQRWADALYDQALRVFDSGEVEDAVELLRKAIETRPHPDYSFFLGVFLLALGDVPSARASFNEVQLLQYSGLYPFWPLPMSPSVFEKSVAALREENPHAETVFDQLMRAFGEFYARETSWP